MSKDEKKDVKLYGKIAKFPNNVKASHAYNFLENIKIPKKKIWYIMIEKQDNELQMIKYNNREGFNLNEFLTQLKEYYSHDNKMENFIEKLEIDGNDKFSIIKNIPDVSIGDKKLISILTEDLIKLLRE